MNLVSEDFETCQAFDGLLNDQTLNPIISRLANIIECISVIFFKNFIPRPWSSSAYWFQARDRSLVGGTLGIKSSGEAYLALSRTNLLK